MKEIIISSHSEKIGNYLRSIIEAEEIVDKKEFRKIYKSLSSGKDKRKNAYQTYKNLKKKKLVKFI